MNGPSARSECRCSQRASSSLPVPLSPSTRTVADTLAILPASVMTSRIAPLRPTTNSRSLCSATWADSVSTRRFRSCFSEAFLTSDLRASYSKSFVM